MLTTKEIRRAFLDYFREQGHELVRSSSLVPRDDPSLLFTSAGMVQFKKIFQGQEKRGFSRATTSQKCLRVGGKHNDLENVGRTARHHTFFEMLGNFSFGDYFKKEAISFAWRFLSENLALPKDRLYATVYRDDDEAIDLWLRHTEIPAGRILRMGEKDNFWTMGDTGPCGPCSEILIDQGEDMSCGPNCGIGLCDCDRFLEIWNLVFMQFNQLESGKREPLPHPSIDTGMGLERIAAVCQGVRSNFDGDLFAGIIHRTCDLAGVAYSHSAPDTNDTDTSLRVIADHSRATAFLIADGIMPSNEGRGYVLRRLIRRACRFGRLLGISESFLHLTSGAVVEEMGDDFPELRSSRDLIARVVREEEERFARTLDKGLILLEEEMNRLQDQNKDLIPGATAFRLYDTYGFPLDIINDMAVKRGFRVDGDGFAAGMAAQKERAKASWKGSGESDLAAGFAAILEDGLSSAFTGYDSLSAESRIIALLDSQGERVLSLACGETGYCVTGATPFYGASGGQTGDTGQMLSAQGQARVTDTLKPSSRLTVHCLSVTRGDILLDAEVTLSVEENSRLASARNHTCTHLLHSALQKTLGGHARQAGSLVSPSRLRFDFTHSSPLTRQELAETERLVNSAILADLPLSVALCSYEEAISGGAMALFGEKYDSTVRVVRIGNESVELCGGTHLQRTGQAGLFAIISESGVAAGVRRIEAASGWNAIALFREQRDELAESAALLKSRPGEIVARLETLQADLRAARASLKKSAAQAASGQGKNLLDHLETVNGIPVLTARCGAVSLKALRELLDDARSRLPSGIICLSAEENGKANLVMAVSKDLCQRFPAPLLIRPAAEAVGGSGGGRPDMAQAGGSNPAGIDAAFAALKRLLLKGSAEG
ncbi:MAG: alanine--tRNA ligase [Deltaproteobacteria bacterium]|nr:alanine--tRNA ligase [Deltaproteobacteria bacterium]